jgi:hypothetical protein
MSQPSPWARDQSKGLQGCGPRGKPGSAKECEGIDPHTPQGNPNFGSWSPSGLPNLQRAIARVKIHRLEELFISLEKY